MKNSSFVQVATVLASVLATMVLGFHSPWDRRMQLPYGRNMRVQIPRGLPPLEDDPAEDLEWWHSLSRNNTIDCECGLYNSSTDVLHWADEGVTKLNHYPWSVSLVAPGGNYAFCGGSLINDRYVLTAAACVDGSNSEDVEVLIGTWYKAHYAKFGDPDELNTTTLIRKKVHRVILHPKYADTILDYNIALLRLKGPVVTFGNKDGIAPVCLPEEDASFDGFNVSSLLWRFHEEDGFILPVKRSEVQSQVLSKTECKDYRYNKEWENLPDSMICSRIDAPPESHPYFSTFDCPGDAGGPLLVEKDTKKYQIGIDSWTACYGRPKGVSIFTRISEFLPWIKLHISEDGRKCSK